MRRLHVGLLCMAFVLSLFVGRLVQLQGLESAAYKVRAEREKTIRLTLPATRGEITDASGHPLAMTVEARAIYADPLNVEPRQKQQIVTTVARILGVSPADIEARLDHPSSRQFTYLARGVPPDKARQILAYGFTGINALREYTRVYPNGPLAAGVVGMVGYDGHGLAGLEYSMDKTLAGKNGSQRVEIGREGQVIPMAEDLRTPPVPGRGLRLTLDRDIQYAAEQALAREVTTSGAAGGTVIVEDPRSGQILALATTPAFDPNDPAHAPPGATADRAVTEVYEPGSTNKVITAAAVLEKGGITPETVFTVPSAIRRAGRVFHDAEPHRTERLTFAGVLAQSSNVGTILASEHVSPDTLYQYMRAFGFGSRTGVGLPGESKGLLPPPGQWWGSQRYTIAFGQGVSVNALQMVTVYATIANGGVRVQPTLVAGTYDDKGQFVPAPAPPRRRVIAQRTATEITRMLEGVTTSQGTAPDAQIPGYQVAGKTGTAQRFDASCGCYRGYTATFVGFAPADDPRLVVEVVLQDPTRGHYGGEVAAPVFKDVMSFALQSRKIPPTGTKSPPIRIFAN